MVVTDLTRDSGDVFVERATHVCVVAEDECPLYIKTTSNNVLRVFPREFASLVWLEFMLEEEFLIV